MNTLVVKNDEGQEITIEVLDIIEDTKTDKSYICYSLVDDEIVFISRLIEDEDSFSLEDVTEEEKKMVETIMLEEDGEENE